LLQKFRENWLTSLIAKFESLGCPQASLPCIGIAISRANQTLKTPSLTSWPLSRNPRLEHFLEELRKGGCNTKYDPREAIRLLRKGTTPPGRSPHHTGRAVDLHVGGKISTKSDNIATQRRSRAYQWLVCNAARFDFYPYFREPWHWEYNPA